MFQISFYAQHNLSWYLNPLHPFVHYSNGDLSSHMLMAGLALPVCHRLRLRRMPGGQANRGAIHSWRDEANDVLLLFAALQRLFYIMLSIRRRKF